MSEKKLFFMRTPFNLGSLIVSEPKHVIEREGMRKRERGKSKRKNGEIELTKFEGVVQESPFFPFFNLLKRLKKGILSLSSILFPSFLGNGERNRMIERERGRERVQEKESE